MKLSRHALDQLKERYKDWGLNINFAVSLIGDISPEYDLKYRMILIDDIPVVLICDYDEVITIYPHPVDAAETWLELLETIKDLRQSKKHLKNALNCANSCNNEKQRYITKIEKKLKHWEQKMKGVWK